MRKAKGKLVRTCLLIFFSFLLVLFASPMMFGIIHIGNVFGSFVCLFALSAIVYSKLYARLISFLWHNKILRVFAIALTAFVSAGLIFVTAASGAMISTNIFNKADGNESALVVLGCKVNGTNPSLMLSRRIEAAYRYHLMHPDVTIIASGGQGNDEGISEAECIKNGLVSRGVPEALIIVEDKSTSTEENLRYSLDMLEAGNAEKNIAVATDGFHQYRVRLIANDISHEENGQPIFVGAVPSYTPWYLLPSYFVREWFGIAERIVFE